jgi:tRNA(Ile)-lysidine synthase
MDGSKLVSDVLTDARVPAHLREGIPVLERDGEILWVCGVRLADGCRVTAATTERAILTFHIATDA